MSAVSVPSHVRHYYRRKRPPFLNLSDLPDDELDVVRAELVEETRAGTNQRNFGPLYMDFRRRTESKMRNLFIESGGEPERLAPHYFGLGQSSWFEGLSPDMAYVELTLDSLPDAQTSFTHPDSFTAMALGPDYGVPYEPRPCHEQVFRIADLPAVVEEFGLPEDPGANGYEGYVSRPFEVYVEVQVWSDDPVAEHLSPEASTR